jgi:filamentous hemagglutinin family protein
MEIPQTQGTRVGNNLFHSFSTFNINNGESALFTGSSTLSNIISRVTGTNASTIDGALDHNMPNACFWLLNPNGIIFGQNASLPTHGAFHATTADYLLFEDGGRFGADTSLPQNRVLSVANPSAFGFIGPNPGSMTVQNSKLIVEDGTGLSLMGGDIEIRGDATQQLVANSGNINLVSVSASGEAAITPQGIDSDAFSQGGTIRLQDSVIHANNSLVEPGTVAISIQGGELVMENSKISANTNQASSDNSGININVKQNITLSASSIHSNIGSIVEPVPINLSAKGDILLQNQSTISTSNYSDADSGDINILAQNLTVETRSNIETTTRDAGNAGNIHIAADRVMLSSSDISAQTLQGSTGQSGEISIIASELIELSNPSYKTGNLAKISASTFSSGDGGKITLSAPELVVSDNASIESNTHSSGHAGNINIDIDSLTLSEGGIISSGVMASGAIGKGGSIHIDAKDSLTIEGYAEYSGLRQPSRIVTGTVAAGDAGDLRISAPVVNIDTGWLNASSKGSGASGSVTLSDVERLSLTGGAQIQALAFASGEGGQVDIEADTIHISGTNTFFRNDQVVPSGVYTGSGGSGHAGNLTLQCERLILDQGGMLESSTAGTGNAGNIFIGTSESPAGNLTLLDGSVISTSTTGLGNAGNIHINATGAVTLQPQSQEAFISSGAWGTNPDALGSAGTIHLNANALNILSGGVIATNTNSHHGTPANIQILVNDLLIEGEGTNTLQAIAALQNGQQSLVPITGIMSDSTTNQRGGSITINITHSAILLSGAITASGSGAGGGGDIFFSNSASPAGLLIIDGNSAIFARAQQGNGGNIFIYPGTFLREGNSQISADSNQGNTGTVEIGSVEQNTTSSILDLDNTPMGPDLLTSQACGIDHIQQQSHLIVGGQNGLKLSPGDYIPSKMSRAVTDEPKERNRAALDN